MADVERSVYFYKVEMLDDGQEWRRADVLNGLAALTGEDRMLALGDDAYAWVQVDRVPTGTQTGRLRLFRDRHRGAMMDRASEAFRLISRGAYRALTTAPNGQSETLIALGADGGSKEAAQLSKGARFQLYLALRVAGYHELAKTRAPARLAS